MATYPDNTTIPGVDRDGLAEAILRDTFVSDWVARRIAGSALAHIASHHECPPAHKHEHEDDSGGWMRPLCDREHADEWVEVGEGVWVNLPGGVRLREEWVLGDPVTSNRHFVHRDDLPDDPRALIARELGPAQAETFLGLLDEHGWTVTRKVTR